MFYPDDFLTETLRTNPQGELVTRILATAINAVAPDEAMRRFVRRNSDQLLIAQRSEDFLTAKHYNLSENKRIFILGLGKAAASMTNTLFSCLADRSPTGLLVVKHASGQVPRGFEQIIGGHPIPNSNSLLASLRLKKLLTQAAPLDLLICAISGGGSALLTSPQPGISLADIQALTTSLLSCGARIDEINILRRQLDTLKGGRMAQLVAPTKVISLILSDVIGSPLESIASGPTAPNPTTPSDALGILEKYRVTSQTAPAIIYSLQKMSKTSQLDLDLFKSVQNVIVGNNELAAQAALEKARTEGLNPFLLRTDLQGEAREAAKQLCKAATRPRPFCIIAGGETTVTLRGTGRGGRNQELALAAVNQLADIPNSLLISLATDGEDGPTDAAGAVVSNLTRNRAEQCGLSTAHYLENNDAYSYFSKLGDLLKPGPTGTNVNDLTFLFGF